MNVTVTTQRDRYLRRAALLILILIAFARLCWDLGGNSLWWDESLSLQRAESAWPDLLMGRLVLTDGMVSVPTIDQHPFAFFVLLGGLLRVAGTSEFVLRFPAAAAAALLVPAIWLLARRLEAEEALPRGTAPWASILAALSPFYLYYGQEARPYTLLPLLVVLTTYLLVCWSGAAGQTRRRTFWMYVAAMLALLATHYLALLVLPVHFVFLVSQYSVRRRRTAVMAAGAIGVVGLAEVAIALLVVARQGGSGSNFGLVSVRTMAGDLLNAFSLGLSVDVDQVRWLNYVFGAVTLLSLLWILERNGRGRASRPLAWLVPSILVIPFAVMQAVQTIQPLYMNARHLSLMSGAFLLLTGAGLARLWAARRWLGAAFAVLMIGGMLYSTHNYFSADQYRKDDFRAAGAYLRQYLQPGDGVVVLPAQMQRLYEYYLPYSVIRDAEARGVRAGWRALPALSGQWEDTERALQEVSRSYRRLWVVASGMVPFSSYQTETYDWFAQHGKQVRDEGFRSNTHLRVSLYLPAMPISNNPPPPTARPLDAHFGTDINLLAYEVGTPIDSEGTIPITLYWQRTQESERRYKYILRLVEDGVEGNTAALTEREPYDGQLGTVFWPAGATVAEFTGLRLPSGGDSGRYRLTAQLYDAATLAKSPASGRDAIDGDTIELRGWNERSPTE